MIFGGPRGPRPEPPREHGGMRNLPRLIAVAVGLMWSADPARFLGSIGLQVVLGIAAGAQLLITRNLIAAVLTPGASEDFSPVVSQLVLLVVAQTTSSFVGLYQEQQQQVLNELATRRAALRIVEVASAVEMKLFETPDFQDRMSRAQTAMGRMFLVTMSMIGVIRSVSLIVGVGVALYILQPLLLLVALLGFVPMWIARTATSRTIWRFFREMTPEDRKRGYVMSLFTSRDVAKEVRAFGLVPYLRALYERLSDERVAKLIQNLRERFRISFLGSAGSAVFQAASYGLLAYLVLTGQIGIPEAGAAAAANAQLGGQLAGLVGQAGQLYESSLFLYDADAFFALLPAIRRRQGGPRGPDRFGRLAVEDVHFTYPTSLPGSGATQPSSRPALRGVSMDIAAGEVVALVGENGSGKTTLAKVLSGLYRPDRGRLAWDGQDVAELDPDWLHDRVAVLFQDFARFMLTVRENIGLGRVERVDDFEAIRVAAERAGVHGFVSQWERGYDTILGPVFAGGKDVSIGQWQRIALARAFFRDAPLVILDEPTAALDARAEHDLFQRIRELFEGRSVLLISHRFSSVRSADRIYVLHEGEVVEHGSHEELMALGGRYAELFTLQAAAYLPQGGWTASRR